VSVGETVLVAFPALSELAAEVFVVDEHPTQVATRNRKASGRFIFL
jgi:hypothetical protein